MIRFLELTKDDKNIWGNVNIFESPRNPVPERSPTPAWIIDDEPEINKWARPDLVEEVG